MKKEKEPEINEEEEGQIDESLLTEEQKEEYGKKMPILPYALVFGAFLVVIIALIVIINVLSK